MTLFPSVKIMTPVEGSVITHKIIDIKWDIPISKNLENSHLQVGRNSIHDYNSVLDEDVNTLFRVKTAHIPSGTTMLNISVWAKLDGKTTLVRSRYEVKLDVDQLNVKDSDDSMKEYDEEFFIQHI